MRAVDDKTAKTLLNDRTKDQLRLDGLLDAVTVICTKTDELTIAEAEKLLPENEVKELNSETTRCRDHIARLKTDLSSFKGKKSEICGAITRLDEQIDAWDLLRDKVENGDVVYPPSFGPAKRKRPSEPTTARKKSHHDVENDSDSSDTEAPEAELDPTDVDVGSQGPRASLTEAEVKENLKSLKAEKKSLHAEEKNIDVQMWSIKTGIKTTKEKEQLVDRTLRNRCLLARNDYAEKAIRRDFAISRQE